MISIIVPAYNSEATLEVCLRNILASDYADFEVIVVDDHSSDNTCAIARSMPCKLIERPVNGGAAAARNTGAAAAQGEILFFVDADVAIQRGAVRRVGTTLAEHPQLTAMFGSYEEQTLGQDFFSQYKNLIHHFTHQTSSPEAKTFASGFGAVRRQAFEALGGFDPARRYMEDVDLGYRMHQMGYRVMLDRDLQGMHRKRYTLISMVRSDFVARAIPWTRLMLEKRIFQNDLNTKVSNVLSIPVSLSILLAPLAFVFHWYAAIVAFAMMAFVALNRRFLGFLLRKRGWRFAIGGAAMTWFVYLYSAVGAMVGVICHLRDRWTSGTDSSDISTAARGGGDLSS